MIFAAAPFFSPKVKEKAAELTTEMRTPTTST